MINLLRLHTLAEVFQISLKIPMAMMRFPRAVRVVLLYLIMKDIWSVLHLRDMSAERNLTGVKKLKILYLS